MRRALPVLALLAAACSPTFIDIRPFAAHPEQKLETEQLLVYEANRLRVAANYVTDAELNEAFRIPGKEYRTGNPFLYKPPLAKARFMVFQLNIRNESEHSATVEYEKIRLMTDSGEELHPVTRTELTNYWMGLVVIRLNKPLTWGDQMEAVKKSTQKEKALWQAVYEGGLLPPKGEHTGYVAFRDVPKNAKILQLLVEIVTRTSRYGNPLNVALVELNFGRERVPVQPKNLEPEDTEGWR